MPLKKQMLVKDAPSEESPEADPAQSTRTTLVQPSAARVSIPIEETRALMANGFWTPNKRETKGFLNKSTAVWKKFLKRKSLIDVHSS